MGLSHVEPAHTDKAAPFIEEFGGKIGGLMAIKHLIPDLRERILDMMIVQPGKEFKKKAPKSSIVRASHRNDFNGLVDALETERCMRDEVLSAIERVRAHARSQKVMDYARYENPSYDGDVTIAVQPYNGVHMGDIVELPNQRFEESGKSKSRYMITWVEGSKPSLAVRKTGIYDDDGERVLSVCGSGQPDRAQKIVEIYKAVREARIVRDDLVFQMEFGGPDERDPMIYQIRAFARRAYADWRVEGVPRYVTKKDVVFGVTPPEGIVLPVRRWNELDHPESPPAEDGMPWALHKTLHRHEHTFRFHPTDMMKAYLVGRQHGSGSVDTNLQHGHFRLAQKADITVFERLSIPSFIFPQNATSVRLWCDGYGYKLEDASGSAADAKPEAV